MIRIGLKSRSVRPCPDIGRHAKFHQNPCTHFGVILLTDRQTNKHRGQSHIPPRLSEVITVGYIGNTSTDYTLYLHNTVNTVKQ